MDTIKRLCPQCANEPSMLFKCHKCDKLFCEQCTLRQKVTRSGGWEERVYYCPKCNSELSESINLAKYIHPL